MPALADIGTAYRISVLSKRIPWWVPNGMVTLWYSEPFIGGVLVWSQYCYHTGFCLGFATEGGFHFDHFVGMKVPISEHQV